MDIDFQTRVFGVGAAALFVLAAIMYDRIKAPYNWIILGALLLVSGWGFWPLVERTAFPDHQQRTHESPAAPTPTPKPKAAPPPIQVQHVAATPEKPKPAISGPAAKWVVTDIALDPPFDEANLRSSYKVKITVRNDGDAASSPVSASHAMEIAYKPLDRAQIDQRFEVIKSTVPLDVDFLAHTAPSLEKGQVAFQDLDGPVSVDDARAVHKGTAQIYVPIRLSWIDAGTPSGMYRTREFCGILGDTLGAYLLCSFHNNEPRLKYLPASGHQPLTRPDKPAEKLP